jgi:phenylalanyl-tRNA synthetase alpha chain
VKQRVINHLHQNHRKRGGSGSPLFTVCERENRVVSCYENFDSLLTPENHISRSPSDTYYVNKDYVLRGHTSAHQHALIRTGLDAFLCVGDVYRRDEIDRTHYPCFHQIEGLFLLCFLSPIFRCLSFLARSIVWKSTKRRQSAI